METQVRTPQMIFMQPQRLVVPLFQRPYIWNEEAQWEPLRNDVVRVTDRPLRQPHGTAPPHPPITAGQQRLTTLQLPFAALHAELMAINATTAALRIEALVRNAEPFC